MIYFFVSGSILLFTGLILLFISLQKPSPIHIFSSTELEENIGKDVGFAYEGFLFKSHVTLDDKDGNPLTHFYFAQLDGVDVFFASNISKDFRDDLLSYLDGIILGEVVYKDEYFKTEEQHLLEGSGLDEVECIITLEEAAFKPGSSKTIQDYPGPSIFAIVLMSVALVPLALGTVSIFKKQ